MFEITSLSLDQNSLTASVNITHYSLPTDGVFHLSSITSARISQQLAIVFTFASLGRPKDAEIYYLKESWVYKNAITDSNNIVFKMNNIRSKESDRGIIYFCEGSINDAFICKEASWFKPHSNIHQSEKN